MFYFTFLLILSANIWIAKTITTPITNANIEVIIVTIFQFTTMPSGTLLLYGINLIIPPKIRPTISESVGNLNFFNNTFETIAPPITPINIPIPINTQGSIIYQLNVKLNNSLTVSFAYPQTAKYIPNIYKIKDPLNPGKIIVAPPTILTKSKVIKYKIDGEVSAWNTSFPGVTKITKAAHNTNPIISHNNLRFSFVLISNNSLLFNSSK